MFDENDCVYKCEILRQLANEFSQLRLTNELRKLPFSTFYWTEIAFKSQALKASAL